MRTRWNSAVLAFCLAVTTAACAADRATDPARDERAVGTSGTPATDPAKRDASRDAGMADRDFVGDMMADGRAEVELGRMAQQKARDRQVKEFAATLVRDHQQAGAELKTVATNASIDMSKIDADVDHGKDVRDRLARLSGSAFDREYIDAMVDEHEKAVNEVEDKADNADNDHVKQWAAKTLPVLKKHLEQARNIQDTLQKRSGS